jgi:hypothetical protein
MIGRVRSNYVAPVSDQTENHARRRIQRLLVSRTLEQAKKELHRSNWCKHVPRGQKMPTYGFLLPVIYFLLIVHSAFAEQASNNINAEQKDIGKINIQIIKDDHYLGVVNQLTRSSDRNVECNGLCYLQNGNKTVSWTCGPKRICTLYCTTNPPVGGCN